VNKIKHSRGREGERSEETKEPIKVKKKRAGRRKTRGTPRGK
jgi:hypothetical protein